MKSPSQRSALFPNSRRAPLEAARGARFKTVICICNLHQSVRLQSPALAASNWRLAAWIAARFCLAHRPRRLTGSSKECPSGSTLTFLSPV